MLKDHESRRGRGARRTGPAKTASPRRGSRRAPGRARRCWSFFSRPARGHAAGRLLQREVPPGAGAAAQQDDVPGRRRLGAQHEGAAHGPDDRCSTKASCPSTVCRTSSASPSKLPRCSGFRVRGALGQQPVVLHVPQHPAAVGQRGLGGGVLRLAAGPDWAFSIASSFFCCSSRRRVQVVQAAVAACRASAAGAGGCRLESCRPARRRHSSGISQSSVYAMSSPSVHRFIASSIVYRSALFARKLLQNPRKSPGTLKFKRPASGEGDVGQRMSVND